MVRGPMELAALNQTTGLTSDDQLLPPFALDEGLAYSQWLKENGLQESELADELNAAGWETTPLPTESDFDQYANGSDGGGTPVLF